MKIYVINTKFLCSFLTSICSAIKLNKDPYEVSRIT